MAAPTLRSGIIGGMVPPRIVGGIGFDVTMIPPPLLLVRDFATLGVDVRSYHEPLKRSVQQVLTPSLRLNFQVGGRPTWEPLTQGTQERKLSEGAKSFMPLIRFGTLQRVAGQLNIWTITREAATIERLPERAWYGGVHQGGAEIPGGEIPARPWAVIQEVDMDDIEEVFFKWIEERLMAHGFRPGIG